MGGVNSLEVGIRYCPSDVYQAITDELNIDHHLDYLRSIKGCVVSEPCKVFNNGSIKWQIRVTFYSRRYLLRLKECNLNFQKVDNPYSLRQYKDHTTKEGDIDGF